MDKIRLPKGTIIHANGMPLELSQDTIFLGRAENFPDPLPPGTHHHKTTKEEREDD